MKEERIWYRGTILTKKEIRQHQERKKENLSKLSLVFNGFLSVTFLFMTVFLLRFLFKLLTTLLKIPATNETFWSNKMVFMLIILCWSGYTVSITLASWCLSYGKTFWEELGKFKLKGGAE